MDFLDPEKQRAHTVRLLTGYILIAIAVVFATLILLYQAYGFGINKQGEVIQNGLVFLSSQPTDAQVYLNGTRHKDTTNTKLQLLAGKYNTELRREGYRSWQRDITVEGGSLQHFDYPLLLPNKITTTAVKAYAAAPGFASQSPDRRWLVVQRDESYLTLDVYDIADPKKVATETKTISVPAALLSNHTIGQHSWKLVEWSTDNRRLLLQHTYEVPAPAVSGSEYVVVDHEDVAQSLNLTRTLALTPTQQLTLRDKKFDKYYVYDSTARTLGTASVDDATKITPLLDQVLAFKSYGANTVLYMTEATATAGKVVSMLSDGDQQHRIREHVATAPYLVDLAKYDGDWFIAVGASGDSKVYVYKNPQRIRKSSATATLVPIQILRVTAPNYLAFSSNTQFLMVQNGTSIAVYDAEYDKGYSYTSSLPIDPPADHAAWMDGNRIAYISGGKLVMFDYDNINAQTIVPASPGYLPFFNRNYSFVYTLAPAVPAAGAPASGGLTLTSSSLRTPEDE